MPGTPPARKRPALFGGWGVFCCLRGGQNIGRRIGLRVGRTHAYTRLMTTTEAPITNQWMLDMMARPAIGKCNSGHTVKGNGLQVVSKGDGLVKCPCGSWARLKFMDVTIVTEKACNGVCMAAQGPSCSCSCGGENHGGRKVFVA